MARPDRTSDIVAEMVANVIRVAVSPGDTIENGDAVVLLESMKMEIPVLTEEDGVVSAVRVSEGDVVQEGDILVTITL
ncbi:MAG TPA: biotin/lipoyl-binding carrier protein [Nocardioidaceae bacterium]|nr:biotin/lipoyl-binding carrier protein [Nocardioidaceae bacterium]